MPKKRTMKVYFRQINYTCIEVEAATHDAAIKRAEAIWKKEGYGEPTVETVEVK